MYKKTALACIGIATVMGLVMMVMFYNNIRFNPVRITGNAYNATKDMKDLQRKLNEIYDANFLFDHTSVNTAKIFLPQYRVTDEDTSNEYADMFGFNDTCEDYDDYYLYKNEYEQLYIDKYSSYLWYEKDNGLEINGEEKNKSDEPQIIELTKQWLNYRMPEIDYKKIAINFDGTRYIVKIISDLHGYENYAFPTILTFNEYGQLLAIDFYFFDYDRIASVNLKTMKQAFNELPIDFEDDVKIDLKSCRLTYIYEESIVQPAYLFEGEITGGNTFQCFVKASKYN